MAYNLSQIMPAERMVVVTNADLEGYGEDVYYLPDGVARAVMMLWQDGETTTPIDAAFVFAKQKATDTPTSISWTSGTLLPFSVKGISTTGITPTGTGDVWYLFFY